MTKRVVDQYSDPAYAVLVKQATLYPAFRRYIQDGEIKEGENIKLASKMFAWDSVRKFPIHTAKHACISYAYALHDRSTPQPVVDNIKRAMELFNVPSDLFATQVTKIASDAQYLIPEKKGFLLDNPANVKMAHNEFLLNHKKLALTTRAKMAAALVDAGRRFKVPISPLTYKFAGLTLSNRVELASWIGARAASLANHPHLKNYKLAYERLQEGVLREKVAELRDRNSLIKVSQAIADLDERTGLNKLYDIKLPDALQTVFNTEKIAAETVEINGKACSLDALSKLPASFWEDLGGKELSNEVAPGGNTVDPATLKTIVDTLPLDLKVILAKQC